MSGTRAGGLKAAKTNRERHGENFYTDLGRAGGQGGKGGNKGFAQPERRESAKYWGSVGGQRSKRVRSKDI